MYPKSLLASTLIAALAPAAWAQSTVQLYGIVDAAIRHTTNEGASGDGKLTQMIGGGMSQSRWGINLTEDLGGGLKALANLENRFLADTGSPATTNYFQQSWVGLQSASFGRLTFGRQYNVLFDVVTSTYASFPYSPYFEAFKPEVGFALSARASNMIKYVIDYGPLRAGVQYSPGEDAPTGGRTAGAYLRYAANGLAIGGAFQNYVFGSGRKIEAWTLGGSYRVNQWYFNAGLGQNKLDGGLLTSPVDLAILSALWSGTSPSNGNFGGPAFLAADKRQIAKLGVGYQVTPQLNLGAHLFRTKQSGPTIAGDARATFFVVAADYALSKRTDAYVELDTTRLKGDANLNGTTSPGGPRSRNGYTIGVRHRF
ncbi:MAG: porin [Variovorax sp.]|jgi:predicted porin|nr:MAG: porin [Variovorax sp.]